MRGPIMATVQTTSLLMTFPNVRPLDARTVTLTEAQWSTIRTAVLCLSVDCRLAGKGTDADYYLNAYNNLKAAMGMDD